MDSAIALVDRGDRPPATNKVMLGGAEEMSAWSCEGGASTTA